VANTDLKYVRATDVDGSSWGAPLTLDSEGEVGAHSSLTMVNGKPAISYLEFTTRVLKYVRAIDVDGASWSPSITVDSAGSTGFYTSLAVVNGLPAISHYGRGDLLYVRATDPDGTSWGASVEVDSSTGMLGVRTSLVVVNGKPAIGYSDVGNAELKYVRANDVDGASWGAPVVLDLWEVCYPSLAVINGRPAISYHPYHYIHELRYVRANDADGASWGAPVVVDQAGAVGRYDSLAEANGQPGISYYDFSNGALKYAHGTSVPVELQSFTVE